MKTDSIRTKSIQYAYPSSHNAYRFGHPRTGCWYVAKHLGLNSKEVKAFGSKEEAIAYVEKTPELAELPWCHYPQVGGLNAPVESASIS